MQTSYQASFCLGNQLSSSGLLPLSVSSLYGSKAEPERQVFLFLVRCFSFLEKKTTKECAHSFVHLMGRGRY